MAVNSLTQNQVYTVLQNIVSQATGATALASVDASNFVSVATTALQTGYDNTIQAISQVLGRDIFSIRPYSQKFASLRVDERKYGNHIRKMNYIDFAPAEDQRQKAVTGASIDPWVVNAPAILQTNFYGQNVMQFSRTRYRDQLDVAFSGPEELARFWEGVVVNDVSTMVKDEEELARQTVCNLIGGVITSGGGNYINLRAAYNTLNGTSYTVAQLMTQANFEPFIRWAYGYIMTVSDYMTERSQLYHTNVTGKAINRHTPKERQRLYMRSDMLNQALTRVLASLFNQENMSLGAVERVSYWQSIQTPDSINQTCCYLKADGTLDTATVTKSGIFAVLFDEDAAGYTRCNEWTAVTPFNPSGGYWNQYYHYTLRYWNDFTENAVVFTIE